MKLKVGDVVEFKKYEDMNGGETMWISEELFPKYGKITEVVSDDFFYIEGDGYLFNPKSVTRVISSKKEGLAMELKVGDIVEFKKYEDMNDDERMMISKDFFPSYGKIEKINVNSLDEFFNIVGNNCIFSKKSIARLIGNVDVDSLNQGDEILVKTTVKEVFNTFLQIEPSIDITDVIDILKRKEPEHFIVQEYCYNMYIGGTRKLVSDKGKAKIYTSRYTANSDAVDMHLNSYDVITYDD